MSRFLATITPVGLGGNLYLVDQVSRPTDPGFGAGAPPTDPGYGHPGWDVSHPGHPLPPFPGRPGNALPIPPVRPSPPITLPPGVWPPQLPPGVDNTLPPGQGGEVAPPIVIPPDPNYGIEAPIYVPKLPPGVAILIALPYATPKAGDPPNTKPAILVQSGKKPVLVYVTAAPTAQPT